MSTALVFLTDGFEEMEAIAPIDLLRRARVDVLTAGVGGTLLTGRNGIPVQADCALETVHGKEFDLLVVPGGPGYTTLSRNPVVLEMLKEQDAAGRLVGAICAAPLVVHAADVLRERPYTAHFTVDETLQGRISDQAVVEDGNLITSQGAGTATEFGLALVRRLCGEEVAKSIADSICYP